MAFLLKFVLGAGIGMVLFSRFISYLFTTRADVPLRFSSWEQWPEVFP